MIITGWLLVPAHNPTMLVPCVNFDYACILTNALLPNIVRQWYCGDAVATGYDFFVILNAVDWFML